MMEKIKEKITAMFENPIIKREVRQTFRKPRIFWILTVYLFALAGVAYYAFNMANSITRYEYDPMASVVIYYVILGMQILIMSFIAPTATASAITGEKERQTFDLLVITKTSMKDIIWGKLLSSILTISIMIVLSMPVYAVIFYYGGVSVFQFILHIVYLITYVAMVGSMGIFFSTVMKKSSAASSVTILMVFVMSIGIWLGIGIIMAIFASISHFSDDLELWRIPGMLFIFNPFVSFVSMIDSQMGTNLSWDFIEDIGFDFKNDIIYAWHLNIIWYIVLTNFFIGLSAKKIAPVRKK